MKIGLTGSIACGKSTVSAMLREMGFPVVDADAISHALTAPGGAALPAIRSAFGDDVFAADHTLDRKQLGALVFSSPEKLKQLNELLHPMILAQIASDLDALDSPDSLVIGDVPLLFECAMDDWFDQIWVVSVSRDTQIARICERDGLTPNEAIQRIDAQMSLEEKARRADAVISTEGTFDETRAQLDKLVRQTLSTFISDQTSISRPKEAQ